MIRNDHLTANFIAVVIALSLAAACAAPMKRPSCNFSDSFCLRTR